MKIGVVGYSLQTFDTEIAKNMLREGVSLLTTETPISEIIIVSGLTNCGIPKIAYEMADQWGIQTIGFSAKEALSSKSGLYKVHQQIIIGDKFGEESEAFVSFIDALIRVGGGKQSHNEVTLFKQRFTTVELEGRLIQYDLNFQYK